MKFRTLWKYLLKARPEQYPLIQWIINDEQSLDLFWKNFISPIELVLTKPWLWRIFNSLSVSEWGKAEEWELICYHMRRKLNFSEFPLNIRDAIQALRSMESIQAAFEGRDGIAFCSRRIEVYKHKDELVDLLTPEEQKVFVGEIFYIPGPNQKGRLPMKVKVNRRLTIRGLALPESVVLTERLGVCTLFRERGTNRIIGSHVPSNYIRGRFWELLKF
jgi:hypothetical protein